jgi:hypothetical protein
MREMFRPKINIQYHLFDCFVSFENSVDLNKLIGESRGTNIAQSWTLQIHLLLGKLNAFYLYTTFKLGVNC